MTDARPDISQGYTRDAAGRVLTVKDSKGYWRYLVDDGEYTLRREINTGAYWAGCRTFATTQDALAHWGTRTDDRAALFTLAIRKEAGL